MLTLFFLVLSFLFYLWHDASATGANPPSNLRIDPVTGQSLMLFRDPNTGKIIAVQVDPNTGKPRFDLPTREYRNEPAIVPPPTGSRQGEAQPGQVYVPPPTGAALREKRAQAIREKMKELRNRGNTDMESNMMDYSGSEQLLFDAE